ncbi:MAG: hypothetical protein IPQ07_34790 [Myxococcales bacterium]|nr:hypothetical protein [Myxococcales bacterium]
MNRAGLVALIGLVAGLVVVIEGTAAAKGGALALPPLEVNLGATAPVTGGEAAPGPSTDVMIGVHWASLYWRPTSYDVGVGYVGSYRDLVPGYRSVATRMTQAGDATTDQMTLHGGYLSLGRTFYSQPHLRAWAEVRGELLLVDTGGRPFSAIGGALRFALELYSTGVGGISNHSTIALFAGTVAIGVYVEASHRDLPSELGPTGVTTGVSFRIPFLLAAAS